MGALSRPEVVKHLGLSDEQQAKIKKIADDARPQGGFGRGGGAGGSDTDRQAMIARAQEQRKKAMTDALAVLDDDQLLRWTEMTGKEFKFPQGFGLFGRGGRGGPGGPGGPPNPGNQ